MTIPPPRLSKRKSFVMDLINPIYCVLHTKQLKLHPNPNITPPPPPTPVHSPPVVFLSAALFQLFVCASLLPPSRRSASRSAACHLSGSCGSSCGLLACPYRPRLPLPRPLPRHSAEMESSRVTLQHEADTRTGLDSHVDSTLLLEESS